MCGLYMSALAQLLEAGGFDVVTDFFAGFGVAEAGLFKFFAVGCSGGRLFEGEYEMFI